MRVLTSWRLSVLAAVALAVAPAAAPLTTVQGDVVDLACALQTDGDCRGPANARRIMEAARDGAAMAIVTADALYRVEGDYISNKNAKLLDFAGRRVEAKGTVRDDNGTLYLNVAAMIVQKPSASGR